MLSKDPACASKATISGLRRLPLHLACAGNLLFDNENLDKVQLLFDAYPEAIDTKDEDGDSPLAIARRFLGHNSDVVTFLRTHLAYAYQAQNVTLMTTPDQNGHLPLHHALQNNASLGAIKLLVKGNSAALQLSDRWGKLPLHIACEFCTANVVQYLAEPDSSVLNNCDLENNSPMHYACRGGNCGAIKYLLGRCVPSVSERNTHDKLPIQLLCECGEEKVDQASPAYIEAIWLLLLAYPETMLSW